MQGWQVFRLLDDLSCGAQKIFNWVSAQRIKPQALGLVKQGGVIKGSVKLVVKINAKQGENLVDRVDQAGVVSLPSCGR